MILIFLSKPLRDNKNQGKSGPRVLVRFGVCLSYFL